MVREKRSFTQFSIDILTLSSSLLNVLNSEGKERVLNINQALEVMARVSRNIKNIEKKLIELRENEYKYHSLK